MEHWGLLAHWMSCGFVPPYCSPVAEDTAGPLINIPGGEFPTMHLSILSAMGIQVVSGSLPSYGAVMTVVGPYFPEATSEGFLGICLWERKGHGTWLVGGQGCDSHWSVFQSEQSVEMLCVPTTLLTFGIAGIFIFIIFIF